MDACIDNQHLTNALPLISLYICMKFNALPLVTIKLFKKSIYYIFLIKKL